MFKDLKDVGVAKMVWYVEAWASRKGWTAMYELDMEDYRDGQTGQVSVAAKDIICQVCHRIFRRVVYKKRCKCMRRKAVSEQHGAVQCQSCQKWFTSRRGSTNCLCLHDRRQYVPLLGQMHETCCPQLLGACMAIE